MRAPGSGPAVHRRGLRLGQSVHRTPALIAQSGQRYFKLNLQLEGTGLLIQDNREAVLRPGDLAIYDTNRPYTLAFEEQARVMVVMFPRDCPIPAAGLRRPAFGRPAGRRTRADRHRGPVHRPARREPRRPQRPQRLPTGHQRPRSRVHDAAFGTGHGPGQDEAPGPAGGVRPRIHRRQPRRSAALARVASRRPISFPRATCTTSSTSPAPPWPAGSGASGWNGAAATCGTRSWRASVGAVAARWGFLDAAHFSRTFRDAFGESPSDWRRGA